METKYALVRPGMIYTGRGFATEEQGSHGMVDWGDADEAMLLSAEEVAQFFHRRGKIEERTNTELSTLVPVRVEDEETIIRKRVRRVHLPNGEVLTDEQPTD